MKFSLKNAIHLTLFAMAFFGVGFAYKYYVPRLETWLLMKVKQQSQAQLPMHITPTNLRLSLLPLGIVIENVSIKPKKELAALMAPTHVKEVGATINLLSLLRGQLRIGRIYLREAEISLFLNTEMFKKEGKTPQTFDFEQIYRLPLDEIQLADILIQGRVDPQGLVFRSEKINLILENRYRSLLLDLLVPKVHLKPSGPRRPITVQLEARTLIESREMQVSAFKLKADESYLVASGRINGDLGRGQIDNIAFDSRLHALLPDVAYWLKTIPEMTKLPPMEGRLDLDIAIDHNQKNASPKMAIELNADAIKIDKFFIGTVKGQGSGDFNSLQIPNLTISNSGGSASLLNSTLEIRPQLKLKTTVKSDKVELGQVLKNLDVHAPVYGEFSAEMPCEGEFIDKKALLSCNGRATGKKLLVHTDPPKKTTIVAIDAISAEGKFTLDNEQMKFTTNLKAPNGSMGKGDGVVNYETGFKINFAADKLMMSDIKNLANLKMEGQTQLTGSTEGTSKWGTVRMDLSATDFWFEDYPFGNLQGKIAYKNMQLYMESIQGQYEVSRYTGNVKVDLENDQLNVEGQLPFVDLKDLFALFQRKVKLQLPMSGTGTGTIKASGPFNFRKMSYQMKSTFYRGAAFNENFDQLNFNVTSENGNVRADDISVTKANGKMVMTGTINPEAEINAMIKGQNMRLEQSENVLKLGLDIQGKADFTVDVKGELPDPNVELSGKISQTVLAERPVDDSTFNLRFLPKRLEGKGLLMGSVIETDFVWPWDEQGAFSLKLKTKKWDFTNIFSLMSQSARQLDFETSVSLEASLKSTTGGFWNADGDVKISEFVIRKGLSSMQAEKPMFLAFSKGHISSRDFSIASGDSYLRLEMDRLHKSALNAALNGKMDLSLLALFTPFISDLRGNVSVSMDLKGTLDTPNMSGSAYIEKGYVKLREFPHPFSAIRSDILFNQRQILLNAIRTDFASGKAAGEGRIEFLGPNNTRVDIRGDFNNVNLNVPEGYHSKGSGQIHIRGNQFPYVMAIDYDIVSGEMVGEFEGTGDKDAVQASAYLPKFIDNSDFQAFTFDLDIDLRNPIKVTNSIVDARVTGSTKVTGTTDRLILNGTFTPLPGGQIFFKDTPFDINNAFVEYQNAPPDNPRLYLSATTTVKETVTGTEGGRNQENSYDVNLLVQGKAKDPTINISSQPPLSQKELVSLLALGLTSEAMDRSRTGTQEGSTSTALGAAILQKPVSKKLKDTLGVDVKVSSSQATQETASAPKVTFSKQWTPKFGASASSTVNSSPTNNVRLEYKFNRGMSVVGSWEGKEQGATQEVKDAAKSVFGLDLEYKVQFK